eukprot:Tamp_25590.p2 GENE.Tamp_25590~~Tamp_25590.p2  ORF type:complete len:142 (+),score=39.45 Tamp_25590:156-581(+)
MRATEISPSAPAGTKQKPREQQAAATRRAPSPKRKGTTDYSKWDAIDSDDEDDGAAASGRTKKDGGGDLLGIPGLNVGKISENDPRVVAAKGDPKVQRLLALLRTSADPEAIEKMMAEPDVAEKMRLLLQAGVVDIRRPGQ